MTETTNIRIRLTKPELDDIEVVRQFLGLRSVSAAAARLAVWNARVLANSLRSDGSADGFADSVSSVASDAVRMAVRQVVLDSVGSK